MISAGASSGNEKEKGQEKRVGECKRRRGEEGKRRRREEGKRRRGDEEMRRGEEKRRSDAPVHQQGAQGPRAGHAEQALVTLEVWELWVHPPLRPRRRKKMRKTPTDREDDGERSATAERYRNTGAPLTNVQGLPDIVTYIAQVHRRGAEMVFERTCSR